MCEISYSSIPGFDVGIFRFSYIERCYRVVVVISTSNYE